MLSLHWVKVLVTALTVVANPIDAREEPWENAYMADNHGKTAEPSGCVCQIIIFYNIRRSKRYHLKACIVVPNMRQEVLDSWVAPAIWDSKSTNRPCGTHQSFLTETSKRSNVSTIYCIFDQVGSFKAFCSCSLHCKWTLAYWDPASNKRLTPCRGSCSSGIAATLQPLLEAHCTPCCWEIWALKWNLKLGGYQTMQLSF